MSPANSRNPNNASQPRSQPDSRARSRADIDSGSSELHSLAVPPQQPTHSRARSRSRPPTATVNPQASGSSITHQSRARSRSRPPAPVNDPPYSLSDVKPPDVSRTAPTSRAPVLAPGANKFLSTFEDVRSSQALVDSIPPGWFCLALRAQRAQRGIWNQSREMNTLGPISYVQFYLTPDSEGQGGGRWKIEHNMLAGRKGHKFRITIPRDQGPPAVSGSGDALALLVLNRFEILPGTPDKAEILRRRIQNISQAISLANAAIEGEFKGRLEEKFHIFLEHVFLQLATLKVVGLPLLRVVREERIHWTYNPKLLVEEVDEALEGLKKAEFTKKIAVNSW